MNFKKIVEAIPSSEYEVSVIRVDGKTLYKGKLANMHSNLLNYIVISVNPDISCKENDPEKYAHVPDYSLPLIIKVGGMTNDEN